LILAAWPERALVAQLFPGQTRRYRTDCLCLIVLSCRSYTSQAYERCIGMSGRNAGGSMLSRAYFNLGLCLWGQLKTERAIPYIST
jgi:hypothetical protein